MRVERQVELLALFVSNVRGSTAWGRAPGMHLQGQRVLQGLLAVLLCPVTVPAMVRVASLGAEERMARVPGCWLVMTRKQLRNRQGFLGRPVGPSGNQQQQHARFPE